MRNRQSTPRCLALVKPDGASKIGPPEKLIYYAWVILHHEVPFEFKNLPLP